MSLNELTAAARRARAGIRGAGRGERAQEVLEALQDGREKDAEEIYELVGKPNGLKDVGIKAILLRLSRYGLLDRRMTREEHAAKRLDGVETTLTSRSYVYRINKKGRDRLAYYLSEPQEEEGLGSPQESTEDLYRYSDSLGGLVEGPVALMRLPEVRMEDFRKRGIRAFPSGRFKFSEEGIVVEKKYDGWLSQSPGGRIFSRRGSIELTERFPAIAKEVSRFDDEHLIGELVYWDPDGEMNELMVTSVAGTEDIAESVAKMKALEKKGGFFQIVLFDVIAYKGRDVSRQPFSQRRKILEGMVSSMDDNEERITLSPVFKFDDWKKVFQASLAEGGEGVVLKNAAAPYFWRDLGEKEPKPAGVQWKVKSIVTDDFIVVSARRTDKGSLLICFGQLWRGQFVEVGELDNFSAELEERILDQLSRGPFVAEIIFQDRFKKFPGRLRSPRWGRFRLDKPIESATFPPEFA